MLLRTKLPLMSALIALSLGLNTLLLQAADAPATYPFDIAQQPLEQAITELARQTGLIIGGDSALLRSKQSRALEGRYDIDQALQQLLAGSGLIAIRDGNTVTIRALDTGDSSAIALDPVQVSAAGLSSSAYGPVNGYLATRSATATRTDTPLNEIPQSISVISAEQIRDQNAQTLQETLRYTAGVHADEYGLDNRGDWFLLRGGSQGSTLLDSLRLPLTGWYGVVRNEPYAFERVEVLRGPSSVMAGQNGPGGCG